MSVVGLWPIYSVGLNQRVPVFLCVEEGVWRDCCGIGRLQKGENLL